MDKKNLTAKVEALLFIHGEPVSIKKLASILKVKEESVKKALQEIEELLESGSRGLSLVTKDKKAQLTTSPELSAVIEKLTKDEFDTKLTPASLETLSIIAYLGPCRRSLIEHIRGVNSSFILRSLMVRGLVERNQDPEKTNSCVYQATFDFLNHMGVKSVEDLPEYEKYRELVKSFFEENGQADSDN